MNEINALDIWTIASLVNFTRYLVISWFVRRRISKRGFLFRHGFCLKVETMSDEEEIASAVPPSPCHYFGLFCCFLRWRLKVTTALSLKIVFWTLQLVLPPHPLPVNVPVTPFSTFSYSLLCCYFNSLHFPAIRIKQVATASYGHRYPRPARLKVKSVEVSRAAALEGPMRPSSRRLARFP